jgi:RNA polymerase sigma factor (sigma-70 family)
MAKQQALPPDEDSVTLLWLAYLKYYSVLRQKLRSLAIGAIAPEEVDEIVDATFLNFVWNVIDGKFEFQGFPSLQKYLIRMAAKKLYRYFRDRRMEQGHMSRYQEQLQREGLDIVLDSVTEWESDEWEGLLRRKKNDTSLLLHECIKQLPELDFEVLRRKLWEKKKVKEIAAALEQKESWVKGRLFRIRDKLKRCLGKDTGELYFNITDEHT